MRHTVLLVWEVNQGVILSSCKFCKISMNVFLQNISAWLLLLRLECKLKLWLQSKKKLHITSMASPSVCLTKLHIWNQYHCNNNWEFKILQQMSSEYLMSTSTYQNWLLICKTGNKWHMCKSVYMEVSGGRNELFQRCLTGFLLSQ